MPKSLAALTHLVGPVYVVAQNRIGQADIPAKSIGISPAGSWASSEGPALESGVRLLPLRRLPRHSLVDHSVTKGIVCRRTFYSLHT